MIRAPECPGCAAELRQRMAAMGVEITVSTAPPIVAGPYTAESFTCPHGVTYWIEPTGEQIAMWAEPEGGRCNRCRSAVVCQICDGKGCGWCPDCSPQVPEWTT